MALIVFKDLKANESRLKDINKVADDLESEGLMAEEVQAVTQQVSVAPERTCPFIPPTTTPPHHPWPSTASWPGCHLNYSSPLSGTVPFSVTAMCWSETEG